MRRRGLTLLEVLLAASITATAILCLCFLFLRGLQLQRKSGQLVQATQLAKRQIEMLRLLPSNAHPSAPAFRYDGRNPDPATAGYPPAPYPGLLLDGREYAVVVDFRPYSDGLRKVRVEVHSGGVKVVLESLLAP